MMNYAIYDASGAITQWGYGVPPGEPYVAHDVADSLDNYRVVGGSVVPKQVMSLTLPAPTAADGVAEAVVAGLPAGTRASFYLSGVFYSVQVDDGTLELSVFDPQTVGIWLWHPLYQHPPVEVAFV